MRIDKVFYLTDDVVLAAKSFIGKWLWTQIDGQLTAGVIVETEAYSFLEKACHAYNNRLTKRTQTLFEEGGTAYVYLCYGIHKLFNIVTNQKGVAEAVLVRAIHPKVGLEAMASRRKMKPNNKALTSGPGKLSVALGIDMAHNNCSLVHNQIWLAHGEDPIDPTQIEASPRIGVDYAQEDALLPWRFTLKGDPWLSK